jgi:hypothetical protein
MIPVLDVEIPRAKSRKLDRFRYITNFDNSQQEYLDVERLCKQPSSKRTSTIIDNLSHNDRFVLRSNKRPLTHRWDVKEFNDEVGTDDYHVYHSEWLKMHCTRRGHVTTTSPEGTKNLKLMDIPLVHPKCGLPSGEWTNFMKITSVMTDFASSCTPKINFPGVDACFFT